ncbi:hypothetical protein HaLaN_22252 [Haematococcus lacustris]|uniref:Uncharacterized protein n=1 Tax=Haematococcus lacustris TaxID=44745 RepID=A0A6A0A3L1_HAELA|nr:hypothetical protein HaLaN_22252 [Haematococcus lacustris]
MATPISDPGSPVSDPNVHAPKSSQKRKQIQEVELMGDKASSGLSCDIARDILEARVAQCFGTMPLRDGRKKNMTTAIMMVVGQHLQEAHDASNMKIFSQFDAPGDRTNYTMASDPRAANFTKRPSAIQCVSKCKSLGCALVDKAFAMLPAQKSKALSKTSQVHPHKVAKREAVPATHHLSNHPTQEGTHHLSNTPAIPQICPTEHVHSSAQCEICVDCAFKVSEAAMEMAKTAHGCAH